jgi:sulfur-oxidizing protein SoxX
MEPRTALTVLLAGAAMAASMTAPADSASERAVVILKSSFKPRGQATLDRLEQDEVQAACSRYKGEPPEAARERIEKSQLAAIRYPGSGKLMGDWRQGERIAQSGVGRQFTDAADGPAGGACYNCHQLSPLELSFGTIGPSLYRFGKLRGSGEAIQKYAYGKIYNSKAFSACSNMPRFGHKQILTEEQITHLVALLLDPESPVNR